MRAFDYILEKRILWNQTNGQFGAYIVAHNMSWGWPGNPANHQTFVNYITDMGNAGIISVGATDNNPNLEINETNDIPTSILNPFLINVTSTNNRDVRFGAYGASRIHLGAPGINVLTATGTNGYTSGSGGTSFAAPMVAGTVGLMYVAASEELLNSFMNNPGDLAQMVKQYILEGVDPVSSLSDVTTTG